MANWKKGVTPKNGQRVIGFYEDGENSFVQLCYFNEEDKQWYGVGGAMPDEQTGTPDYWSEKPGRADATDSEKQEEAEDVYIEPGYHDEIIIYDYDKHKKLVEAAGYEFEDGECVVSMTFGDGKAVSDDGKLEMIYPTVDEVRKSDEMQEAIYNYTGRPDINQYDIALRYGEVRLPVKSERQMSKGCLFCGAELNVMGNSDCSPENPDGTLVTYLHCPKCGRDYEITDPSEEDRKNLEYWR